MQVLTSIETRLVLDQGQYSLRVDVSKFEVTRRWLIDNGIKFNFKTYQGDYGCCVYFTLRQAPETAIARLASKFGVYSKQPIPANVRSTWINT
jgi:hypothetical protein